MIHSRTWQKTQTSGAQSVPLNNIQKGGCGVNVVGYTTHAARWLLTRSFERSLQVRAGTISASRLVRGTADLTGTISPSLDKVPTLREGFPVMKTEY